jgi:hypothetical protein
MTSRRTLWSILATLPLIVFVTTGCDLVFSLDYVADIKDNALKCDCACTGGGSRNQLIVASSDDAEQAGTAMDLTGTQLDLGTNIVGLRFDKLMLPHGATIQSARVQFSSDTTDFSSSNLTIKAQVSPAAAPFSTASNDLSSRTTGLETPVSWNPVPNWGAGQGGFNQLSPELNQIVQEAVNTPGWNNDSALVLLFQVGTGHRAAKSFDLTPSRAPILLLSYDASASAVLPICARPDITLTDEGRIPPETVTSECERLQTTFTNLAGACGFPSDNCHCSVVDVPDQDDSFEAVSCQADCEHVAPDMTCSNFDPNGFTDCLGAGTPLETCKAYVAATDTDSTTPEDTPVCVASGSPLAFHAYGHRSQCDVTGTADIQVGDHEPEHNPGARGRVEFLEANCPGPDCSVSPYFDLTMDDITFEVRFHSDPTFGDLSAIGRSFDVAPVDAGMATFGQDTVDGSANGRRGDGGKTIGATNENDLLVGVDFVARTCSMNGNVAGSINQRVCDGDSSVECTTNTDCDDASVDGPCVDADDMTVDVALDTGELVNQPPTAVAGDDEMVECTSPAGADFLLDGSGSSDPDADLALTLWRGDARNGPLVSDDIAPLVSLGVGVSRDFFLRVIDTHAQTDDDTKTVGVVDTTAPVIACNAPATMRPPSKPVSFAGTATDVCDAAVPPAVTAFSCFKVDTKGRVTDKTKSCGLTVVGGTITVSNKAGVGDHVRWTLSSTDDTGNNATKVCEVLIVS